MKFIKTILIVLLISNVSLIAGQVITEVQDRSLYELNVGQFTDVQLLTKFLSLMKNLENKDIKNIQEMQSSVKIFYTNLNQFPDEILLEIFSHLPTELDTYGFKVFQEVCKRWQSLAARRVTSVSFYTHYYQRLYKITDVDLLWISQHCPFLEKLSIGSNQEITDKGLTHISLGCPNLRSLHVFCCTKISDQGIKHISLGCPKLQELSLSGCGITNESLRYLSQNCNDLRNLNFCNFCVYPCAMLRINDEGIKYLSQGCHLLQKLDLQHCYVTDAGLRYLASGCKFLEYIDLRPSYSHGYVTGAGISDLRQSCPCLTTVLTNY